MDFMDYLFKPIKKCIEQKLDMGFRKFVIFPFGKLGMQVKNILRDVYGIEAEYILHSRLWKYNPDIKPLEFLDTISCNGLCALLTVTNGRAYIYEECKKALQKYFADEAIGEFLLIGGTLHTEIGKYSYGPLCRNHPHIESIGAFSSFAYGTDVVPNHPVECITTHPIIMNKIKSHKRIKIGNDVWLGRNVIITNYANIGNGVIAGAGAIITKDVPDYAVVAGVPARIIRFRYSSEQIASLNKIAWWDWTDDEIGERYEDFLLPINKFIEKYRSII